MWSPRGTSSAEKGGNQKETTQGGRAGARGTTEESTKTQNRLLPFVCSPLRGVATPRLLQTLLRVQASALPGVPCPEVPVSGRLSGFEMSRGSAVPEAQATSSGIGAR